MEDLLAGPNPLEARAGVTTVIPAGTRLLGLTISKGVATVDLSSEFESGGGSASMFARLAQVACTLDQFPTLDIGFRRLLTAFQELEEQIVSAMY